MCCTTPGRELIGFGSSIPSATNMGRMRFFGVSVVSAVIARITGLVRSLRGRRIGRGNPNCSRSISRDDSEAPDVVIKTTLIKTRTRPDSPWLRPWFYANDDAFCAAVAVALQPAIAQHALPARPPAPGCLPAPARHLHADRTREPWLRPSARCRQ